MPGPRGAAGAENTGVLMRSGWPRHSCCATAVPQPQSAQSMRPVDAEPAHAAMHRGAIDASRRAASEILPWQAASTARSLASGPSPTVSGHRRRDAPAGRRPRYSPSSQSAAAKAIALSSSRILPASDGLRISWRAAFERLSGWCQPAHVFPSSRSSSHGRSPRSLSRAG